MKDRRLDNQERLSQIGEAVVHIGKDFLDKYEYPWYQVRAFRNLISHEYFQIQLRLVWVVIVKDLPELKKTIERILEITAEGNDR